MRANADGEDVAADDGVHPHRSVLAEDDVTDDLSGVVDVTAWRNRRPHAFKGSNHASLRLVIIGQT
jgi:hypothetical protein